MGRLWREYVARHWPWLAVAVLLMVVEGSTLGLLSYTLQPMFDRVFVDGDVGAMWWVGGVILSLFVIRAVTGVAQRVILTRVAQLTSTDMQTDLLAHMMTLDSTYFQRNAPGALIERVQGDTLAVQNVWQVLIQGLGRDVVSLLSLFVVAVTIDVGWTAIAVVGIPLLILPTVALQKYVRRKTRQMRSDSRHRATRLDEIFHGIDAIKLNGLEPYQLARFRKVVDRIVHSQIKSAAGRALLPGMIDIVTGLGFFGVLVLGGRDIISGEKTVGEFMSFFTAMALAFQPLRRIGAISGTFQVAAASLENIYTVFATRPTILSAPRQIAPIAGTPEIEVEHVTFGYDDTPVLRDLTFRARAGKTTALVGASGAGKSTIFRLLTRLVQPSQGTIAMNGQSIADMPLDALRGMVSIVSQDALLFDETIRENILLGRRDVSEDALRRAVEDARVADFADDMPLGLDTLAGPRGSNLSGGQRQRVAIARALLRNTPVLLLDEATSALDAQSEAAVQAALERLSEGRTTLVIAHRLSTVRTADCIVVLDQGRVADSGTHDDLLARGGIYADLYRLQFDENRIRQWRTA
ncbi:ABC transporter ATP-binding protein [Oceaniovalibus guishaninsula]|nr:ABC transporter ATP-binding protein [Oceaniovalibus guishaninsula]